MAGALSSMLDPGGQAGQETAPVSTGASPITPQGYPTGQVTSAPAPPAAGAPGAPAQPSAAPSAPAIPGVSEAQMQDIALRGAFKKYAGVTIDANELRTGAWFEAYGERIAQGMPVERAVSETAIEFGFVADGASSLKGLPDSEKEALFEKELSSFLSDPELNQALQQLVPAGVDLEKFKLGVVLETMASQGRFIPERYLPYLDRARGLEDPDFVSDELKTWVLEKTGVPLEMHEDPARAVAQARKEMEDNAIVQAARGTAADTTARIEAERALEKSKPISAEDSAKYGTGATFPTYQSIADDGKRFPTENERKIYSEFQGIHEKMKNMKGRLFGTEANKFTDGIFTGIGDSMPARIRGRAGLVADKLAGNERGQNLELYNDLMASYARALIKIAGETGSRLTDVDIRQIMMSMPDAGSGLLGVPDSEALAQKKLNVFLTDIGRRMNQMLGTLVIRPTEAPPVTQDEADAAARELINKYKGGQ